MAKEEASSRREENVQPDLDSQYLKSAFNTVSINISFNGILVFDIARHYGSSTTFGAEVFDVLSKFAVMKCAGVFSNHKTM